MLMIMVRLGMQAWLSCFTASCQELRSVSWSAVLSWYVAWMTPSLKGDVPFQCEGQVRNDEAVQFRCGESVLVVNVGFEPTKGCLVRFMRRAFSDETQQTTKGRP